MSAFTAREAARDVFHVARNMGTAPVVGADPQDIYAARRETWLRALGLVDRAHGTARVLAREPDDQQLEAMASHAQGELDALDAAEDARRHAQRTRHRELVEPATFRIGPRTWLQPDGTFR